MNSKIALVSANTYTVPYPVYPLGVSYLATYLAQRLPEAEVRIFDFNLGTLDDFAIFLRDGRFDYLGLSLRNIDDTNIFSCNSFVAHYKNIIKVARENSSATIIAGGPGFSVFPELLFKELMPDYAVKGEGEESLCQLLTALDAKHDVSKIEGLVWDLHGEVTVNSRSNYISAPSLEMDSRLSDYYWSRSGMLNIQTKRGCPYECIYCSYPIIDGSKVRVLDAATVVSNIERMHRDHGINYLFFTDSIFNIDRAYNRELAQRIIASGVKLRWGAYFSPNNLTAEDLELYSRSGLTHIEFGTDSFSDTQLRNYRKRFTFDDVLARSRDCDDLGINYAHFLILGGYGETESTLDETFANSSLLGSTVIFPYVGMRIYPRTQLCDIAIVEGVIKDEAELIDPTYYVSKEVNISTLHERAAKTGKRWVFPDEESSPVIERLRERKRRGPLWEYLRFDK